MNRILNIFLSICFLNFIIYPALADEYLVLPPIVEEENTGNYNPDYDKPLSDFNSPLENNSYSSPSNTPTTLDTLKGRITTVPVGTAFQVITDDSLNSKRSMVGEIFKATLNQPISVNGDIIIPAGSEVIGQITYLQEAGRIGKNAKMEIKFTSIKPLYGNKVPIIAKVLTEDNTGIIKGGSLKEQLVSGAKAQALITAGGTLAGASVGAALGGVTAGAGAAVGAASGAGIGLAYLFWRKGKPVAIPSGTKMVVMLEQPFNVSK